MEQILDSSIFLLYHLLSLCQSLLYIANKIFHNKFTNLLLFTILFLEFYRRKDFVNFSSKPLLIVSNIFKTKSYLDVTQSPVLVLMVTKTLNLILKDLIIPSSLAGRFHTSCNNLIINLHQLKVWITLLVRKYECYNLIMICYLPFNSE